MNRSRRCAAVIAAGGLGIGWAVLTAAAGTADPGRDGSWHQDGVPPAGQISREALDRPGYGRRAVARGPEDPSPDWPCPLPWPWPCPPWPQPVNWKTNNRSVNAEIMVAAVAAVRLPTIAQAEPVPAIEELLAGLAPEEPGAESAAPAPAPAPAQAAAMSATIRRTPGLGGPLPPPPPVPPPTVPVTPTTPPASAPPPPPRSSETVVAQPSLARLATLALPGLAGLAGLTGVGGYFGYRQAKAGFALRAAGTARFLA